MSEADSSATVDQIVGIVERLGRGLLSLLKLVVFLTFLIFAIFLGAYLYALFEMTPADARRDASLQVIERIMLQVWDRLMPVATTALRIIAPVIILLLAIALLLALARRGAQPFDIPKLVSDLPSFLAILIIVTICLLPLAGIAIPDVLNNVALVVVGFYFGKRTGRAEEHEHHTSS